jgi:hypothetical protein
MVFKWQFALIAVFIAHRSSNINVPLGSPFPRVASSIPTQGEIKKKGYILSRHSEVTLSRWSRSIELIIMPLIDL